jgi:ketosteroid isomerase-like protein
MLFTHGLNSSSKDKCRVYCPEPWFTTPDIEIHSALNNSAGGYSLGAFMGSEEAIKSANLEFYKAIESGVIERMKDVWWHSENARCVHPGWDLLVGWSRILAAWEQIFASAEKMRISPTDVYVYRSGEIAWVTCIENITVFQAASFDTVQAVATNLFIERDGKWLLLHHHASPIPPLALDSQSDTIQ